MKVLARFAVCGSFFVAGLWLFDFIAQPSWFAGVWSIALVVCGAANVPTAVLR